MKLVKVVLMMLIAAMPATAQEFELGKVTKEELEQKNHPKESSAGAAILYSKGMTYMTYSQNSGFDLVTEVEMKIKIYNKEGYDWANKIMPYYSNGSSRESIDVSKAVTYNLVDGEIVKTKLKSEGEFVEEVNKNWNHKKIVMPNIKEGSIVEYKYVYRSPFITALPEWRFQESIPVNYSEYNTHIPEYYVYNPVFRGYLTPKIVTSSSTNTNYRENIVKYIIKDIPSLKDEDYVNNIDNYIASVEHELSSAKIPNQPVKVFSTTWEDLTKTIYQGDNFGPELKKTGYFEKDIDALTAGLKPEEKLKVIFSYVRDRMTWNKFTGYSCDKGVRTAYNEKTGNAAEINLMLTSMLRYAGLDANPVLVSTINNKIALYPNFSAYNYVISAVNVNGKKVLLDATSKSALPDIMPMRTLNWTGRLVKKDGTAESVNLFPSSKSREVINITATLAADGKLTGSARDQYMDYNAFVFRDNYKSLTKDTYVEKIEKQYKGIEINDYTVSDDTDLYKPVVENYNFIHNALTDIIGNKMYISPMLFLKEDENPFKEETRLYPIDFLFPRQDKYMINIKLPEGYAVESVPTPISLVTPDNICAFKFNIVSQNNQVQVVATMDINHAMVSADYYSTLKDFFTKMIDKQNEKIVLKKI